MRNSFSALKPLFLSAALSAFPARAQLAQVERDVADRASQALVLKQSERELQSEELSRAIDPKAAEVEDVKSYVDAKRARALAGRVYDYASYLALAADRLSDAVLERGVPAPSKMPDFPEFIAPRLAEAAKAAAPAAK